jgi:acyl-CoA synthetase (AMP-forming)/AMP-acid ligase II
MPYWFARVGVPILGQHRWPVCSMGPHIHQETTMGVIALFDRGASLYPDRDCLVDATGARTYRQVRDRVQRIANALYASGFQAGQRIAVLSPNGSSAFEAMLSSYRAGGIFVPLGATAHVDENAYILQRTETSVLFFHSAKADRLDALRADCPSLTTLVCVDTALPGYASLEDWIAADHPTAPQTLETPQGVVSLYHTGGTTGRPKGVPFTSLIWDTVAANFYAHMPCEHPPVYLAVTPMTHGAGTTGIPMLAKGGTIILHPGFDAQAVLQAIDRHRVTHLWLPPTAIYMLLTHPALRQHDYASLICFMYSAAPMSVDKLKECIAVFGNVMVQVYGQTEAPMFATCLSSAEHAIAADGSHRLASCGRPMVFTPVEVMDDDGNLLGPNERGEVVIGGNLVMPGYYRNPEATAEAMTNGWLRTGDVGFKDEAGYVFLIDRKKRLIITGGFNVYPGEVERVLLAHPAVQDCAVVGVPDEKWGEAVKAVLELKPGAAVAEDEVIAFCKAQLGSVKTPKTVEVRDALPRTSVGKVDARAIRAPYWEKLERAI